MTFLSEQGTATPPETRNSRVQDRIQLRALARLLLGANGDLEHLPRMTDMTAAAAALARGTRRKALLPLTHQAAEMAWLRRGDEVLVSYYETGSSPEVITLDREIPIRDLVEQCAKAAVEVSESTPDPTARQITRRLAERALRSDCNDGYRVPAEYIRRCGGHSTPPKDTPGLAFGFQADILPNGETSVNGASQADIHALLFQGQLWTYVRGKRLRICNGPVLLVAQRMLLAVRSLVDAWEAERSTNVRLRAGQFQIQVRLENQDDVSVTLGHEVHGAATATAMSVADAALPILRLVGDLVRALISTDRAQSRNLRVRSIREEVRALRRIIRERNRTDSFTNTAPDRLRPTKTERPSQPPSLTPAPESNARSGLRFSERWRIEVDGIDANGMFFCGDRLVLATSNHTVALDRDSGDILWARTGNQITCLMTGTTLLRIGTGGDVELCSVEDGEPYAHTQLEPQSSVNARALHVGGVGIPPMAVFSNAGGGLVAIDLRTGQPRWRFSTRGQTPAKIVKAGRVILAVCGDGAINAIDAVSGEVAWRFAQRTRFSFAPGVCEDTVVAVSGHSRARRCTLFGLDLFSGELKWSTEVDAPPAGPPLTVRSAGLLPVGGPGAASLASFDPTCGTLNWMVSDPGLGRGGSHLTHDHQLVVNSPSGQLTSLALETGEARWTRKLFDPMCDDTPRRLEPVLRGGALFVPSSKVHVIRPHDGSSIGTAIPSDLIPDALRVDERSWAFVAEESGMLAAYAPVPQLKLIRGGAK